MRALIAAVLALVFGCGLAVADTPETPAHSPRLLLTAQRLRRLKRDRTRQTVRWVNFEKRVQSVPDSPERGFELALYFAITQDESFGRKAIEWGMAHPNEPRQLALIGDWCGSLMTGDQLKRLQPRFGDGPADFKGLRDRIFVQEAFQGDEAEATGSAWAQLLQPLLRKGISSINRESFYALCEYLDTVRMDEHKDLRRDAPEFFSNLPSELLLSLKPAEVEHPAWMLHCAALALVTLDPNLESSQYLQGWAIEDGQLLREGPGVAYELIWGDPYLPGVSYQNLAPWIYDSQGRFFARSDWSPSACWVSISAGAVDQLNCPASWKKSRVDFGRMALFPFTEPCTNVSHRGVNEYAMLWQVRPNATLRYKDEQQTQTVKADGTGLVRVPERAEGKLCVAR